MPSADADRIVAEVAAAVGLVEGVTGVRAVVATLARLEPVSIRRISRAAELPVPIVAAICGELRRRAVVSNERPARLTERGRKLYAVGALRLDPRGLGAVAAEIARATATAPPARVELDQCHCTFDTKLRRVLALHEADALVGRRILLLGDDDLTALALLHVVRRLGSPATLASLTVLDVDRAVVDFVRSGLAAAPFPVACVRHDLREPLPRRLVGGFDTVVTDPPYTVEAVGLFLSRAADALAGPGGDVFLSFGSRRPAAAFRLQQAVTELGFSIRSLVRDFNEYVGAGVLGGTSHLYHLRATSELRPLVAGRYDGPLYTAEIPAAVAGT